MAAYTNAYKGRKNRQESASHLRDEFDRIAAAFITIQNENTSYGNIYNYGDSTEYVLIDPANGQMQEVTLTQDTLIEIQNPGSESSSDTHKLTLIVHGNGFKVINGWGPQTWKDHGNSDWLWIYTGPTQKAGTVLEFAFDGLAWCCLAFSRNPLPLDAPFLGTTATFPLISDLWDANNEVELTWERSSYGWSLDIDATYVLLPADAARFTGARYVKNWIATPNDLQSEAFEVDGATVTTEAGAGSDGGDVDKITFTGNNGEVRTWMLLHFGRPDESSDPIKFVISFDAKMAGAVTSGTCRAVIAVMGVDSGSTVQWDRVEFNIDNNWNSYGAVLDPITNKNPKGLNINGPAGARTLVKFAIESPSDGLGDPILIENVNVVIPKEGDDELPSLPITSSIGSSLILAATAGSTGTWVDGTKTMTLALDEYVDFQDSLAIGEAYLCVARRNTGNSADVLLENDRTYWKAYSQWNQDTTFVKDAPFTFFYEGGSFKFLQKSLSSEYTVNIYKISNHYSIYGTTNANAIGANRRITYTEGSSISSNIAVGAGYEKNAATNLLPVNLHRDFSQWDNPASMRVRRSEYGVDGRPCHGTFIEDNSINAAGYIVEALTIPDDTSLTIFSVYIRRTYDSNGSIIHPSQLSPAAGGPVTPPSRYVDLKLLIYDDAQVNTANWINGDLLRVGLVEGQLNIANFNYDFITGINYQHWFHVQLGLRNNATGNDRIALLILPSVGASFNDPGAQTLSKRGYAIVDWAQAEVGNNASSLVLPGDPRAAETISTTLDDGILYNTGSDEVGDVTANVFNFDETSIYKYITWVKS